MSGAQEKDCVRRQSRGFAQVMARIGGLREAGEFERAREELARACAMWLGVEGALLERLEVETVVGLLGSQEKVEAYREILEAEASVAVAEKDEQRIEWMRIRAQELGRLTSA